MSCLSIPAKWTCSPESKCEATVTGFLQLRSRVFGVMVRTLSKPSKPPDPRRTASAPYTARPLLHPKLYTSSVFEGIQVLPSTTVA